MNLQNTRTRLSGTRSMLICSLLLGLLLLSACKEEPFEPSITGSIQGQVKDAESGAPLENATVTTQPATDAVVTAADGLYEFSKIDTGTYKIIAEKLDYNSRILSVKVREDQTSSVTILLTPKEGAGINEVRFTGIFSPVEGALEQPVAPTLTWQTINEGSGDSVTYDVFLYPSDAPSKTRVAKGITDTSITVDPLAYNKVYHWQVKAMDEEGDATFSQTLSFKTMSIPDNAFFFVRKTDGNYEIMAYDFENELSNQLTFNSYRDWAPKINPQNGRIAFVSDSLVNPYLYTMDKSGGNILKVTDISVDGYHNYGNAFDWDENQGKILFSHYQYLYEINADGSNLRAIATAPSGRHFREVEVSPDGSRLLVLTIGEKIYTSEIYIMDRNGSNRQMIIGDRNGIVRSPSWSIDGQSILFTHDVSGNESITGRMLDSRIFRYDLGSGETTNLSQNKPQGTNDMYPRFSPTGAQIIFTNVPNNDSRPPDIWVMDENGENREQLVTNGELPHWKE